MSKQKKQKEKKKRLPKNYGRNVYRKKNALFTHPWLANIESLNHVARKKKPSKKKLKRKWKKQYKLYLKAWKSSKKLRKSFHKPVFDEKKLMITWASRIKQEKKIDKPLSLKKFAKTHKIKLKRLKKLMKVVKEVIIDKSWKKLQKKKKKQALKLRKKNMHKIKCGQEECRFKVWVPKKITDIIMCSICLQDILANRKRDTYLGYKPAKIKRIKLLWKKTKKRMAKNGN